jgi:transposase
MRKSLSLDILERVVALVDDGFSCHEAARRLRISAASAVRIIHLKRRTGGVKAASQGCPRYSKLEAVSDGFISRVETDPDITLPELAEGFCRKVLRSFPCWLILRHGFKTSKQQVVVRNG